MSLGANEEEARITSAGVVAAASRWHPGKGQGLEKLLGSLYNLEMVALTVMLSLRCWRILPQLLW